MAFEDLFGIYPNRNAELRSVARQAYEFGKTIAKEPSASLATGLDDHALKRQKSYIDYMNGMVDALNAKPLPDMPATHPVNLDINLSDAYVTFTTNVGGAQVPINEATQLISEYWMILAVELAKSNSASVAGSLIEFDYQRAKNNISTLDKLIAEMTARPILDLPETAEPGSGYQVPSVKK